jgi:hypothetical protein
MTEETIKSNVDVEAHNPTQHQEVKPVQKHELTNIQSINGGINTINFFDEKQLAAAENFLTKVMRSEKGGIKSVNDGLAVLMRAQDLGLPFSTCIEHIHVINGKTGIDVHIVKALLSKAGVTWDCTKDYTPLYEYTDGFNAYIDNSFPDYVKRCTNHADAKAKQEANKDDDIVYVWPVKWYQDFNGNLYKDYQLNTKQFTIVVNRLQANEVAKTGKIPVYRIPNKPVDYITEYKFERVINGKTMTATSRFTYSDAVQADMFEKDTYKKYPRVLISHRAFTLGARDIASDILMGVMETTELKIVNGKDLSPADVASFEDADVIDV